MNFERVRFALQESQESMLASSMTPYTSNTSTPSHSTDVTKKAVNTRYIAASGQPMVHPAQQPHSMQEQLQAQQPSQLQVPQQRPLQQQVVLSQTIQAPNQQGLVTEQQQQQPSLGAMMGGVPSTPQTTQQMANPMAVMSQSHLSQPGMGQPAPMGGGQMMLQQQQPGGMQQTTGQWSNQAVQPSATPMDTTPVGTTPVLQAGPAAMGAETIGQLDETNVKSAQKLSEKMRKDEMLGDMATISSVLYCNMRHPELKTEFPNWNDRWKQISKRWRLLSNEEKQPFLQQARDNRSASKMKKTQQVPQLSPKDGNSNSSGTMNIVGPSSASSPSCSSSSNISGSLTTESGSILIGSDQTVAAGGLLQQHQINIHHHHHPQQQQQHQHQQHQQPLGGHPQPMQQQATASLGQQQQLLHSSNTPLQSQLLEVQGNSLDDGNNSLDEL
uniref:HMG box domain-containing protein n=1 Tax=Anopheles maculatus TaxID=74869 RepID=A0A182T7P3_9DIPT